MCPCLKCPVSQLDWTRHSIQRSPAKSIRTIESLKDAKRVLEFFGIKRPINILVLSALAGWLAGKRRQISIPFVLLLFNNSVTVGWRAVARLLSTTSCALLHPSWTARHPSRAVEWSECYYLPPWTTCFVVQCPIKIGLVEPLHHKIACTRSWIYSGLCIPFASFSWPVYLPEEEVEVQQEPLNYKS